MMPSGLSLQLQPTGRWNETKAVKRRSSVILTFVMADHKFGTEDDAFSVGTVEEQPQAEPTHAAGGQDCTKDDYFHNTLGTIYRIAQDVANIEMEIHQCSQGDFTKLDEMLIQQIIKLDAVDPRGHEKIKVERKRAIRYVQDCMKLLDLKTGRCNETDDEI